MILPQPARYGNCFVRVKGSKNARLTKNGQTGEFGTVIQLPAGGIRSHSRAVNGDAVAHAEQGGGDGRAAVAYDGQGAGRAVGRDRDDALIAARPLNILREVGGRRRVNAERDDLRLAAPARARVHGELRSGRAVDVYVYAVNGRGRRRHRRGRRRRRGGQVADGRHGGHGAAVC